MGTFAAATAPATGYNGLAVTNDGTAAYAIQQGFTTGSPILVYRYSFLTGATTTYNLGNATVTGTAAVGGAINPVTGIYYVYYSTGSGTFDLYGFDTRTNTTHRAGRLGHRLQHDRRQRRHRLRQPGPAVRAGVRHDDRHDAAGPAEPDRPHHRGLGRAHRVRRVQPGRPARRSTA